MEKLGDILGRLTPISTSRGSTGASSDAEAESACPLCRGAGFLRADVPVGHRDFGKVFPCECTKTQWEAESHGRLLRYSNLGSLSRLTFDNLIPQGRSADARNQEHFSHCLAAARRFAEAPEGWLVLLGPSGCGKTHLAAAIANRCVALGRTVLFMVVADLLDHLRATFGPQSDISYDELFEQVRNTPLMIMDDLGAYSSTPWAQEKLYQIINHRYNAQLPTVFTIATALDEMDERLRTRLADPALSQVCVVEEVAPPLYQQVGGLELEMLRSMTFESFDPRGVQLGGDVRRNLEEAFRLAHSFAEAPEGWLVFQGVQGCGKTHLAAAIANYCLRAGHPVFFAVVPDLLDHLRSTFNPESRTSYDRVFEEVRRAKLLILDDFGSHKTSAWAEEKLYQLINYRYNARLPTVFATVLSLEEMEPRISSRMADHRVSTVFNIVAPDFRGHVEPPPPKRRGRSPASR